MGKGRRKQQPIFSRVGKIDLEAPAGKGLAREGEGQELTSDPQPAGSSATLAPPVVSPETGLPVPGELCGEITSGIQDEAEGPVLLQAPSAPGELKVAVALQSTVPRAEVQVAAVPQEPALPTLPEAAAAPPTPVQEPVAKTAGPEISAPLLPEAGVEAPVPPPAPKILRKIRTSGRSHDFGEVAVGEYEDWELTVHNKGEEVLTIFGLRGLPADGFSLIDPPAEPFPLAPRSSLTLALRFAPESPGSKRATLSIRNDDPNNLNPEVLLCGSAIRVASAAVIYSPLVNSLGMAFVYIPEGNFIMGSPEDEPGRNPDEIPHKVTFSKAFYMQTMPVTQGQWRTLMDTNPSTFIDGGDDCPVEGVSWNDCQEFIKKLNARGEGTYRLPTEAEWEYACRAGSESAFANGEIFKLFCEPDPNLDALGWYCGNSGRHTHPVGQKEPNAWGLYDMHGNVSEWCQDWYGLYPEKPQVDPVGPRSGKERVFRGGSLFSSAKNCRSAHRSKWPPHSHTKLQVLGFRLVRKL